MKLFDLFSAEAVCRRRYSWTRPPTSGKHQVRAADGRTPRMSATPTALPFGGGPTRIVPAARTASQSHISGGIGRATVTLTNTAAEPTASQVAQRPPAPTSSAASVPAAKTCRTETPGSLKPKRTWNRNPTAVRRAELRGAATTTRAEERAGRASRKSLECSLSTGIAIKGHRPCGRDSRNAVKDEAVKKAASPKKWPGKPRIYLKNILRPFPKHVKCKK